MILLSKIYQNSSLIQNQKIGKQFKKAHSFSSISNVDYRNSIGVFGSVCMFCFHYLSDGHTKHKFFFVSFCLQVFFQVRTCGRVHNTRKMVMQKKGHSHFTRQPYRGFSLAYTMERCTFPYWYISISAATQSRTQNIRISLYVLAEQFTQIVVPVYHSSMNWFVVVFLCGLQ